MKAIISKGLLKGTIDVPSSKSLCHRAIIAACLAKGKSIIRNVIYSKDILATIEGMKSLGATINRYDDYLEIIGSEVKRINKIIDANESGSTLRFLIPIASTINESVTFTGKNNLPNRPLDVYFDIFNEQGIKYEYQDKYLPLTIHNAIKPGVYNVRGDVSSQFITGLLYALPLLHDDSVINITTPLESKGYIDLTLDILNKFGINILKIKKGYKIAGNQEYKPFDYTVEGDFSQAAFYLVADMLGSEVSLKQMKLNSLQGDKKILNDIMDFGGLVYYDNELLSCKRRENKRARINFSQSPDLGPILSVLAALSKGKSKFVDVKRLRIKECDRVSAMEEELTKLGANVKSSYDKMQFIGVDRLHGAIVDAHKDHRIAMALAIAGTVCEGDVTILNAECVSKSYPNFFEDFAGLGGKVRYEE